MNYLFVYGGAIGDALLGIHMGRTLAANVPGARLVMISTRANPFMRDLTAPLSFIDYRELPKEEWRSWVMVLGLMRQSWKMALFEPVTTAMPLWWRLVLWAASRRAGSRELRYQMKLHERTASRRAQVIVYDCSTTNLFSLAAQAVGTLGVELRQKLQPVLEAPGGSAPIDGPYIVFHFFAGHIRRSIPTDHARDLLEEARRLYPQHQFVLTCDARERDRAEAIAAGIPNVSIQSGLPAQELLNLLTHARLVVGTASGVIHMAAHLRVPTVSLCNLSDPCWLPAYNPDVTLLAAREHCGCGGNRNGVCEIQTPEGAVFRCLYDIPTEAIIVAMQEKVVSN